MNKQLTLKSINDLLGLKFHIAHYQRGYKWSSQQVIDLLDDIKDFAQKRINDKLTVNEFYCLQPLVVKKTEDMYRVVDGQQRLTTLYLILKYLQLNLKEEIIFENIYQIEYETRKGSWKYLNNIYDKHGQNRLENIDYFHFTQAYEAIQNWFYNNQNVNFYDILDVILNRHLKNEGPIHNLRFIWYEIGNEDEIKIFTRLNIGKIPLTNGELIKALFVVNIPDAKESERIILCSEWDEIEKILQCDNFFTFLEKENKGKSVNRIDYIFDLIVETNVAQDCHYKNDNRKSFYYFNEIIKKESYEGVIKQWNEVKYYIRLFKELYEDNVYYHKVGFLTNTGYSMNEIVNSYRKNTKEHFKETCLDELIKNQFKGNLKKANISKLEQLSFHSNKKLIFDLLFLFNVIITMNSKYSRYPFDIHQKEKWSLEHIHAQNSEQIKDEKKMLKLIQSQEEFIQDEELELIAKNALESDKIKESDFEIFMNKMFYRYSDQGVDSNENRMHMISNLALLSLSNNSALNNNIFPVKVKMLKEIDKAGGFIPLGTKNVFLKYYSDSNRNDLIWDQNDQLKYLAILNEVLKIYLPEN